MDVCGALGVIELAFGISSRGIEALALAAVKEGQCAVGRVHL